MDVCIGKSAAVNRDVAVAYLTCNGSPPVGDKPSLMTFREVETLFHEVSKHELEEPKNDQHLSHPMYFFCFDSIAVWTRVRDRKLV